LARLSFPQFVWKGVRRRTFRNVVSVLTFAVVTGSLLSAYFLIGGAQNSAQAGMSRMGADLLVVPEQYETATDAIILTGHPSTFFINRSALDGVSSVAGVEKVATQTYIATLNAGCCAIPTQMIAFNASNDFTVTPWLETELGRPLVPNEIIIGHQVRVFTGTDVGSLVKFYGHDFTVAGVLEQTGMGMDQSVFVQEEDAYVMAQYSGQLAAQALSLKPGQISSVLVKLTPEADAEQVAAQIESAVPGTGVITSNYLARQINGQLSGAMGSLYMTAAAVTIVSVPLVATVSTMVANERKREIGLLRAMGANKRFVFTAIMVEALILAGIGALIGALATGAIIVVFQDLITSSLGIPFLWPSIGELLFQVGIVSLGAIAIGGLASTYPALKASRLDPYEAIRAGQS
jgi:putative ABC transport system permease protein